MISTPGAVPRIRRKSPSNRPVWQGVQIRLIGRSGLFLSGAVAGFWPHFSQSFTGVSLSGAVLPFVETGVTGETASRRDGHFLTKMGGAQTKSPSYGTRKPSGSRRRVAELSSTALAHYSPKRAVLERVFQANWLMECRSESLPICRLLARQSLSGSTSDQPVKRWAMAISDF